MDIKEELSSIEDDFSEFKSNFETSYVTMVMALLIPFVCCIVILSRFFPDIFALLPVRIALFTVIILLTGLHFYLRNTYYQTNSRYRSFIKEKIDQLQSRFPDRDIKNEIKNFISEGYPESKKIFFINVKKVV